MAISMTKLSSADYYLDRTREALQADGAIPDEATPGPLTGPDPAAYYNAEGNPPGRWIGSASRLLGGETGRQAGAETVRMLINERRNPETGRSLDQAGIRADNDGQPPIAGYDLTQTVPKSVSILWAFADQDTRRPGPGPAASPARPATGSPASPSTTGTPGTATPTRTRTWSSPTGCAAPRTANGPRSTAAPSTGPPSN